MPDRAWRHSGRNCLFSLILSAFHTIIQADFIALPATGSGWRLIFVHEKGNN